jgi:hypothetical protein
MPIIRSPSNCRCSLWFPYECGGGSVLSRGRFVHCVYCAVRNASLHKTDTFCTLRVNALSDIFPRIIHQVSGSTVAVMKNAGKKIILHYTAVHESVKTVNYFVITYVIYVTEMRVED